MQPKADRLGVGHQQLRQCMTSSTWPVERVRARLARPAVAVAVAVAVRKRTPSARPPCLFPWAYAWWLWLA
ncbi:hypothetical protein [Streptomyces sp. PU-14G]|uniref:hypothetical protein n=1 Tax=Streptomyces sp. PU-14G TaxID=2800808 RepID=UPI0034DFE76F